MTTTIEAPVTTTVEPSAVEVLPEGAQRDAKGLFIMEGGIRLPVNEPGLVDLAGTPAEAALATIKSLTAAIDALAEQRDTQKDLVKAVLGDHAIGILRGKPLVNWTWGTRTTVNGAIVKAMSPAVWKVAAKVTPTRPFNLAK